MIAFNGSLFRAFTNFRAVLPVNNSLVCCIRPASSWPRNSLSLVLIDIRMFMYYVVKMYCVAMYGTDLMQRRTRE